MSKIKDAIAYMNTEKCTAYEAAKHFGISPSGISAELKRSADREARRCAWCGSVPRKVKGDKS